MRMHRSLIGSVLAVGCILLSGPDHASAQGQPVRPLEIRRVDGKPEPTPVYGAKGANTSGRSKDWFRAYAEYDTEADWTDDLSFTFYIRVKARTRDVPPYTVFRNETVYMNVPKGKAHIADVFLHPNVLLRYGDVDAVAVEVRQGGRVVARDGKPKPTEAWWDKFAPVQGLLLNRSQSPFAMLDLDIQELIKPTQP